MSLHVGDLAPDFELASHRGGKVRLSSFSGKKAVLIAFHPLAWTPVCATQMSSYERDSSWLGAHGTHVLSISVDSVPCKIEWAKSLGGFRTICSATSFRTGAWPSATAWPDRTGCRSGRFFSLISGDGLPSRASTIFRHCLITEKSGRRSRGWRGSKKRDQNEPCPDIRSTVRRSQMRHSTLRQGQFQGHNGANATYDKYRLSIYLALAVRWPRG